MAVSKAQQKAVNKYVKSNYDRIELVVKPKGRKEDIKAHASAMGETLNSFITRAINETMERDGFSTAAPIDKKRFLGGDMSYQLEIGSIIGMDNLSPLADYLRQQSK